MGFPPMSFMRRARSCVSGNLFLSQGSFSFATLLVANFPARDSTLLFAGNACLVLRALVLACIVSSHLWRGIRPCVRALALPGGIESGPTRNHHAHFIKSKSCEPAAAWSAVCHVRRDCFVCTSST